MKIVINSCYGGFGFSKEFKEYWEKTRQLMNDRYELDFYIDDDICRADEKLISALERFGLKESSDHCARLKIVTIPDYATDYRIEEYDGAEHVLYVVDGKIHVEY